jgi:pimeloyl-ACP methyl ester carboxylesterase
MKNTIRALLVLLVGFTACTGSWGQDQPPAGNDAEVVPEAPTQTDLFARDTYRIDTLICPFKGDIDYKPGEVECGLLQVPENREKPNSRMIELMFVKLNARWGREDFEKNRNKDALKFAEGLADGKREDPVIYLTGGPGAPAADYVKRFKDHTLIDYRDMYILEQRGIADSGEVCPFFETRKPEASDVHTWEEYLETDDIARIDCARNATARGVDLTAYNTRENARDVKALRKALGFANWNVWGISYGSVLGQAYVKEDPEGIRAVALDAIMPLDIQGQSEPWRVIHWFVRDLEKLQEICQHQKGCARNYPDMLGRLRQATQSVIDQPITIDVKDTELFPSGTATIFQDIAAFLPFSLLYEQDNYPAVPGLIYAWADALERRDEALFKTLAGSAGEGGGLDEVSQGMYMAIVCNDGHQQAQGLAMLRDLEEYPVLGSVRGTKQSIERDTALCAEVGLPMRPASDYTATQTDIPTLIIDGDMDPITPPPNAKSILPGFSKGTYVEFPYAGHGPSRSVQCAGHMLNRFYDDPTAEPDFSCRESMKEPKLWAPMYTTDLAPRLGSIYFENKKKLIGPGVWAGSSILVSVIAFLVLSVAPLGRWLNRREAATSDKARLFAWAAAACAVGAIAILGAGVAVTVEASEVAILFGLVPWARYGAWLGLAAGLVGLVAVVIAIGSRRRGLIGSGSMVGFVLTGAAAVGLSSFMLMWGLSPF